MSKTKSSSSSIIISLGVLFILFLALKVSEVIAWSWWYVFAPIWIPFALIVIALFSIGAYVVFRKVK